MIKRTLVKEPFARIGNYHRYLLDKKGWEWAGCRVGVENTGSLRQKTQSQLGSCTVHPTVSCPQPCSSYSSSCWVSPSSIVSLSCKNPLCFGETGIEDRDGNSCLRDVCLQTFQLLYTRKSVNPTLYGQLCQVSLTQLLTVIHWVQKHPHHPSMGLCPVEYPAWGFRPLLLFMGSSFCRKLTRVSLWMAQKGSWVTGIAMKFMETFFFQTLHEVHKTLAPLGTKCQD